MKAKILIVDDEEILRRIYSDRLNFEGFVVDSAADGEEAINKMRTFQPNLVLLDILMPKLNGIQVLQAMSQDATLKTIPVIVLSNVANDENIKQALALGAKDYLLKTNFSPNEIIAKITAQVGDGGEKVYKIAPREGTADVVKLSQDFPFLNLYKCPNCGGNVLFQLKPDPNPETHQFTTTFVCESCKKQL